MQKEVHFELLAFQLYTLVLDMRFLMFKLLDVVIVDIVAASLSHSTLSISSQFFWATCKGFTTTLPRFYSNFTDLHGLQFIMANLHALLIFRGSDVGTN